MQLFSPRANRFAVVASLAGAGGLVFAIVVIWYYLSPKFTQVGYSPAQPIAYSHRLHARELGIDCRYCHSNVERSAVANVPPTQTCMNCHQAVKAESPKLAVLRDAWETPDARLQWIRIHKLPDYAYFDHSAHVSVGVACVQCHGRIDEMEQVRQSKPLSMGWCLECHRDVREKQGASEFLRPVDEITNMDWKRDPSQPIKLPRTLNPPENCSSCHR
jgi:hypothetical protein